MWRLEKPSTKLIDWYKKTMLPGLKKRILDSKELPEAVKEILLPRQIPFEERDDKVLIELLIGDPRSSKDLNDSLVVRIKSPFDSYCLVSATKTIDKVLEKVFDYEAQLGQKKSRAYELTHYQGRNTCAYCNRSYTLTVVRTDMESSAFPGFGRTNTSNRIARPHLDHWFNKATYPLLSLNIYNLIPSCPVCNSSLKGSEPFSLETHIHPYLYEKSEPPFRFQISPNKNRNGMKRFPYVVTIDSSQCDNKELAMIKAFALEEVYAYHGMLEAKDILNWRRENNATYLKGLFNRVLAQYRLSTEEVFRMFFGTEYLMEKNLDRPLSKLKRDILIQIELLDKDGNFRE